MTPPRWSPSSRWWSGAGL